MHVVCWYFVAYWCKTKMNERPKIYFRAHRSWTTLNDDVTYKHGGVSSAKIFQYYGQRTETDRVIKCYNLPLLLLAPVSLNCRKCNTYIRTNTITVKLGIFNVKETEIPWIYLWMNYQLSLMVWKICFVS